MLPVSRRMPVAVVGVVAVACVGLVAEARAQVPAVRSTKDIPYATVAGKSVGLYLFRP
jgi:hypothetical protein